MKRRAAPAPALRDRIENDVFFASDDRPRAPPTIPEAVFYAHRPRPPAEVPVAVRAAATPMRFALVVFLVGWAGILFQAGLFQQIVFGAPVFEELAKLGPALIAALLLRARTLWVRVPLALASGAAFGVMEHYVTYVEEDTVTYAGRVVFHALAPALSIVVYTALEDYPDVRARWASTIPATLFHWANNFAAVLFGFGSIFAPFSLDAVALGWSGLVTASMGVLLVVALVLRPKVEIGMRRALEAAMPKLGFVRPTIVPEERRLDDLQPL